MSVQGGFQSPSRSNVASSNETDTKPLVIGGRVRVGPCSTNNFIRCGQWGRGVMRSGLVMRCGISPVNGVADGQDHGVLVALIAILTQTRVVVFAKVVIAAEVARQL